MNIPKKEFFFQGLAVAQLPILPVMSVDKLHQLQIHVGLQVGVIFHYKFIFCGLLTCRMPFIVYNSLQINCN